MPAARPPCIKTRNSKSSFDAGQALGTGPASAQGPDTAISGPCFFREAGLSAKACRAAMILLRQMISRLAVDRIGHATHYRPQQVSDNGAVLARNRQESTAFQPRAGLFPRAPETCPG
jgi:hypothetical protein